MSRLPVPGSDNDIWGSVLNDFLSVELGADGFLKPNGSLAAKANDSSVVHNTTDELIAGTKTFGSSPIVPTPTIGGQAANKIYVDSVATNGASAATSSSPGIVQLAGDLSGTATTPIVAKLSGITLPGSVPSIGNVLTATSATTTSWTAPAAGVTLDATSADIAPLGIQLAGSIGKAADAGHVHPIPRHDQLLAPTSAVAWNTQKITGLANGTAVTDAAAFGQIPLAGTSSGTYAAGNDSRIIGAIQSTSSVSGDLSGTLLSPTVTKLQGNPIAAGTPTTNTVLSWTGSSWASTAISAISYTQQVLIPSLVGDGTTDDSGVIQAALNSINTTANGTELVVASPNVSGTIYINNVVEMQTSNTRVRFASPVVFGPNGFVRIQGGFAQSSNGHLSTGSTLSVGATSMTLQPGTVSSLGITVGSQLTMHGNRTAYGVAIAHETAYVSAVSGDTLTLTQGLQNSYQYSYTNSYGSGNTWNTVLTEVALIFGTPITAGNTRGSTVLSVSSTANLVPGQFIYISDGDVCWNPTNGTAQTTNFQHREIAEIKVVVDATHIQISHALHHTYDLSTYAQISVLSPVANSEITGLTATFSGGVGSGSAKYAVQVQYAVNCRVKQVELIGTGPTSTTPWGNSWNKEAVRFYVAYLCVAEDIDIRDPARTDSGSGYGLTFYAATYCTAHTIRVTSCRHSVLLFNGSAGNVMDQVISQDVGYSDLDFHGSENVDNMFSECLVIGGSSQPMTSWSSGSGPVYDTSPVKAACRAGDPSHSPGDKYNSWRNITVVNYPGYLVEIIADSSDNEIRDSTVNGALGLVYLSAAGGPTGNAGQTLYVQNTRLRNITASDLTSTSGPLNVNGGTSTIVTGLLLQDIHFVRQAYGLSVSNATDVKLRRITFDAPAMASATYGLTVASVTKLVVEDGDWSYLARFVSLTTVPSFLIARNTVAKLTDSIVLKDYGGNTGGIFTGNVYPGYTVISQSGGSGPTTGLITDWAVTSAASYTTDLPSRHGLIEWNYDPTGVGSGSGQVMTAQTLYLMSVIPNVTGSVAKITLILGTLGVGLSGCYAVIYDQTGAQIGITADSSSSLQSPGTTGAVALSLSSSISLTAGLTYYVGMYVNTATTAPAVVRQGSGATSALNVGQSKGTLRFATGGTSLSSVPASITITSLSGTGAQGYWVGLS